MGPLLVRSLTAVVNRGISIFLPVWPGSVATHGDHSITTQIMKLDDYKSMMVREMTSAWSQAQEA